MSDLDWRVLHSTMTVADLQRHRFYDKGYEALRTGVNWPDLDLDKQDPSLTFTLMDVLVRGRGIKDAIWAMHCLLSNKAPQIISLFVARQAMRAGYLAKKGRRHRAEVQMQILASVKHVLELISDKGLENTDSRWAAIYPWYEPHLQWLADPAT